jgi:hypothetical protein
VRVGIGDRFLQRREQYGLIVEDLSTENAVARMSREKAYAANLSKAFRRSI